jgi:hypothetical protein
MLFLTPSLIARIRFIVCCAYLGFRGLASFTDFTYTCCIFSTEAADAPGDELQ